MRITALLVTLAVAAGAFGADSSQMRRTKADLRAISTAAEAYFTDHNGYPQHYRVASAGPDRKFDSTTLDLGKRPAKSDDVVYADVELIRP